MSGGITGFHHVGVSVSSLERAIAFYRDQLGMAQACDILPFSGEAYLHIMALPDPRGRMVVMAKGTLMLELFEFDQPAPRPNPPDRPVSDHGYTHFGVTVDDIDGMVARMAEAGVRFHSPVLAIGSMKAAYGRDPDGNVFELLEPRADL